MRWAIVSDVHGNLPALESVLASLDQGRAVDSFTFLGDIVGYGADPNGCIETLQAVCSFWVAGNHDHGVLGLTGIECFNQEAQEAIEWCRNLIQPQHRAFLEGIPLVNQADDFLCVHATPQAPEAWDYIFTWEAAEEAFAAFELNLCFLGHSHIPLFLCQDPDGQTHVVTNHEISILPGHRYLINPGSIGQPRDGDVRASFGIYDSERQTFSLQRVDYKVQDAAQKILRAGLPPSLAQRLYFGV